MDGVIATNTTVSRNELIEEPDIAQEGGLSGKPLAAQANTVIKQLRQALGADFPIIGVGGVDSAAALHDKFAAGANLVQIYTGLVYQGPGLVEELVSELEDIGC